MTTIPPKDSHAQQPSEEAAETMDKTDQRRVQLHLGKLDI